MNEIVGCPKRIKVMIVDDSAIIRSLIDRTFADTSQIEVVGFAANGEEALNNVLTCQPDIIILDIEMPVMDGITALPLLKKAHPQVKIIICSTLSQRGADISVKALTLGASDYILKPTGTQGVRDGQQFKADLIQLILSLSSVEPVKLPSKENCAKEPTLAKTTKRPLSVLAIGSSTGGPTALIEFFRITGQLPVPVIVTQHMPKMFTSVLANQISNDSHVPCREGVNGETLSPGQIYLAPGDLHMTVKRRDYKTTIHLDDGPLENFCRPAVDPMLRSVADVYGDAVLAVILTGMGSDGLVGCQAVSQANGIIAAQDESTSVVWGMPRVVAESGLCSQILPLKDLALWVKKQFD